MLDQVTRTYREYPVLPGTTEDQGVLWYMSTVLLTAFGFFCVATPFRPLSITRNENISSRMPSDGRGRWFDPSIAHSIRVVLCSDNANPGIGLELLTDPFYNSSTPTRPNNGI
jgi:hypothetical protein